MNKKSVHFLSNIIILLVFLSLFSATTFVNYEGREASIDPYYNGNVLHKRISIMINVYWGTEYISGILDVLDDYDAKATFFVGGCWAEKNEEVLVGIFNRGHEIGSHGYLHRDHKRLSLQENKNEILFTEKIVEKICGIKMNLFAPPSGSYGKNTIAACETLGYNVIMWNRDTIDWRDKDINLIISRATKNLAPGNLVLMHPTQATLDALPSILEYYSSNFYKICTVTENIS